MTVPSFIEEKLGNGVSLTTVTEDQSPRSRLIALDETDETAPYEASGTVINAIRAYFKVDAATLIKALFNNFPIIIPLLKHEPITFCIENSIFQHYLSNCNHPKPGPLFLQNFPTLHFLT